MAEELNGHFLVKKAEIASSKLEHQSSFFNRRISVDEFGWHVELGQRYMNSLLDAMAIITAYRWVLFFFKEQEGNSAMEKLDAQYMKGDVWTLPSARWKS